MHDVNHPTDDSEQRPDTSTQSRRAFLGRFAALGAAGLGLSSAVAACGGGEDGGQQAPAATESAPAGDGDQVVAADCEGFDALTDQDLQMRETLQYADESPNPEQLCNNCRFYNEPADGEVCGGCQLFKGPVAPEGWCSSWAAMEAA
ncbi:MAG: hypothetical protein GVY18_12325 [Bacteroidetes bacterium]|jgi:hypothetical protein|nr:hypothetical protein [Bacteroidota bacterium]